MLEGILSVLWDRKYPTHTLSKSLWSSNSTFLLVFLALTMCDTVSFSAGHRTAIERRHIVIIKIISKYVHVLKLNKRCVT